MRAGRLDRKIDIERKSTSQDSFGQPVETWSKIAARRAASVRPLRGEERFADQWIARQQVEFRVRYSTALAALSPLDRIVYPAAAAGASPVPTPADSEIYDVIEVAELGRRSGLVIRAARRAEVSA